MIDETSFVRFAHEAGGLMRNTHVALSSGLHSDVYIDKSAILVDPTLAEWVCLRIGAAFEHFSVIGLIAGPAPIGSVLAAGVQRFFVNHPEASTCGYNRGVGLAVAEKEYLPASEPLIQHAVVLPPDHRLLMATGSLFFRHGFARNMNGTAVVLVDDIVTTGNSLRQMADAVERAGGYVVGAGVMWNRSGVTAQEIGVPLLYSAITERLPHWTPEACASEGPCSRDEPLLTGVVGHGYR